MSHLVRTGVIGATLLHVLCADLRANVPDLTPVIKNCSAAIELPEVISFSATEHLSESIGSPVGELLASNSKDCRIEFRKDGDLIDVSREETTSSSDKAAASINKFTRGIITNTSSYLYDVSGKQSVVVQDSAARLKNRALWCLGYGRALDGYMLGMGNGAESVFTVLEHAQDGHIQRVQDNDMLCWLVQAKTQWGYLSVWIAEKTSVPTRIRLQRNVDDLYFLGRSLGKSGVLRQAVEIFPLRYKAIGGKWIGQSATIKIMETLLDGRSRTTEIRHERRDLAASKTWDPNRTFVLEAPDGTTVVKQGDNSGLQYEWRAGKVVPRYRRDVVHELDGTVQHLEPFRRHKWSANSPLVQGAAMSGIGALAIGYIAYKSRKRGG